MHSTTWFSICCSALVWFSCGSGNNVPPNPDADASTDAPAIGQLGGACFPNQTCYGNLRCRESVCVETADDGGVVGDGSNCSSACAAGSWECVGDKVRSCATDKQGCTSWTAAQPCPTDRPFCSNGACEAKCTDECSTAGSRRCSGSGYQECGQFDSDPCFEWGLTVSCGKDELCQAATGQCVPSCNGQPCACKAGETKACAETGECKGGQRSCINGEFGPCQWTVGPTPESCDGKDNDCDGFIDEAEELIAPPCSKQSGVCQGAVKACAGTSGWQDCNDAAYAAFATSKGLVYEIVESKCDGQDNDCNSKTDEPAGCCKPSCTDKTCGAPDGCGNICLTGSCSYPQEVCQQGICVCQPDCTGKVCGGPDGCGKTCKVGSCAAPNSVCNAGSCVCAYASCGSTCCAAGEYCQDSVCMPGVIPGWKVVSSNTLQDLKGVWGAASNNVWAVGTYGTILHYDGSKWSPDNSGTTAELRAVYGSAVTDVWVVGYKVILHHDGSSWSPSTYLNTTDDLRDVWATAGHAFVAGDDGQFDSTYRAPVISHYNGSWTRWEHPTSNGYFTCIGGSAASNVWAEGWKALANYDGSSWTTSTVPASFGLGLLWGMHVVGTNNAWGVGSNNGYCMIFHWEGTTWNPVSCPTTQGLQRIHGTSASDLWAVGYNGTIIHYDGKGWSLSGTGVTTKPLKGVWAASATEAWAVGDDGTILHYTP